MIFGFYTRFAYRISITKPCLTEAGSSLSAEEATPANFGEWIQGIADVFMRPYNSERGRA